MFKITLRLYRSQFAAFIGFIPDPRNLSFRESLGLRIEELILLDYRAKLTPAQVFTWRNRPTTKRFAVTISLQVARALYAELQAHQLTPELQGLLCELDQELVNAGLTD
ncbi:hypothetical protein CLV58_101205 [Spirosoma oryzae]|uniref:Uncharacterized protein n=1 Tax=Spirosoma oryzae TaxID=1469603 RepID=A0A2T0TNE2_9BACT|nr:hypothetical protein [Spirosoma oryzae]PRY47139.1 hypothetical protein CLV58_101205 [Spirosoma oryzae]